MIISSRRRVSNVLFSSSCRNWPNATRATPGLLATTRNASLWVRRAGNPIASPSSRARSSDTIGTRAVIVLLRSSLWLRREVGFPGIEVHRNGNVLLHDDPTALLPAIDVCDARGEIDRAAFGVGRHDALDGMAISDTAHGSHIDIADLVFQRAFGAAEEFLPVFAECL